MLLDPPYAGRQGYGQAANHAAAAVYERWRRAGARVGLCEGRRLDLDGRVVDLTDRRRGQFRRSLTTSLREFLHVSS